MLTRRAMLRSLLSLPIAATLDIEKLLWIPGQMVVVPQTYGVHRIMLDDINAATLRMWVPAIEQFFTADPFLKMLKDRTQLSFDGRTIEVPILYDRQPVGQG
jgi:hypothetical protein